MMSTHFGNYETNRPGFQKLLRGLSDKAWEDAFDLIKHIGKRGEKMNFGMPTQTEEDLQEIDQDSGKYELYELESLAKALDIEKELALEAHAIHKKATRSREEYHDPEVSHYIEEKFVRGHADIIRKLSGYISDVRGFFNGHDGPLALYLFDEYLKG